MKHIIISDIHGRSIWKDILEEEKTFDKVIFLGDYFDSFDIDIDTQIKNFQEIVNFKNENYDKVHLLVGNHDYHYLDFTNSKYSGYSEIIKLNGIVKRHLDLFEMCYQYNQYLCTHAGISSEFMQRLNKLYKGDEYEICNILNDCFKYTPQLFDFAVMANDMEYPDGYGNRMYQSPIWIRPNALERSNLDFNVQIVGHTAQDKIKILSNIVLTDCYDTCEQYVTIEDGLIQIKTL